MAAGDGCGGRRGGLSGTGPLCKGTGCYDYPPKSVSECHTDYFSDSIVLHRVTEHVAYVYCHYTARMCQYRGRGTSMCMLGPFAGSCAVILRN